MEAPHFKVHIGQETLSMVRCVAVWYESCAKPIDEMRFLFDFSYLISGMPQMQMFWIDTSFIVVCEM